MVLLMVTPLRGDLSKSPLGLLIHFKGLKGQRGFALMQRMTDFCQAVSMSRPFGTLSSRVIPDPTLRNLSVSCMGLLKFSLYEAVEKSVRYIIRAKGFNVLTQIGH